MSSVKPYDMCWLDYRTLKIKDFDLFRTICIVDNDKSLEVPIKELKHFIKYSFKINPRVIKGSFDFSKYILIGKIDQMKDIIKEAKMWERKLNNEGFILKRIKENDKDILIITAKNERALVYAVF